MSRMYILVNKDIGMSKGKCAAQVAHAVVRLEVAAPHTVIVLEASNDQLKNLSTYLKERDILAYLYIDEGVNEVEPFTCTAMAVEPIEDDDYENKEIFENLKLLGEKSWLKKFFS